MKRWACVLSAAATLAVLGATAGSASASFPMFVGSLPPATETTVEYQPRALKLETVGGDKIRCNSFYTELQVLSPTEVLLNLDGVACLHLNRPCFSAGSEVGNMTFTMEGTLHYIDRSKRKVGLLLEGHPADETDEFTRAFCFSWDEGGELIVHGEVVPVVTPVDKVTESIKLTFKEEKGIQAVAGVEAVETSSLFTLLPTASDVQTGLAMSVVLRFPGMMELAG
jgi:hypothetical protein